MAHKTKNFVVVIVPEGGNKAEGKHHAVDLENTPQIGDRVALDTGKSYLVTEVIDDPAIQVVSVLFLDETTEQQEAVAV